MSKPQRTGLVEVYFGGTHIGTVNPLTCGGYYCDVSEDGHEVHRDCDLAPGRPGATRVPTPFADLAERDPTLADLVACARQAPGRAHLWMALRDRAEEAGAPPELLDQVDAWREAARNLFLEGLPRRERQRRIQAFQYYFDAVMGTLAHVRAERTIPF